MKNSTQRAQTEIRASTANLLSTSIQNVTICRGQTFLSVHGHFVWSSLVNIDPAVSQGSVQRDSRCDKGMNRVSLGDNSCTNEPISIRQTIQLKRARFTSKGREKRTDHCEMCAFACSEKHLSFGDVQLCYDLQVILWNPYLKHLIGVMSSGLHFKSVLVQKINPRWYGEARKDMKTYLKAILNRTNRS